MRINWIFDDRIENTEGLGLSFTGGSIYNLSSKIFSAPWRSDYTDGIIVAI